MRGTRWLILLAIVAVIAGSAYLYRLDQANAKRHQVARPAILEADTNATAIDYQWAQSSGGFASVEVKAREFRQVRDTPNYDLKGLELKLNQKDHQHYDLIKSASAKFNQAEGRMYSDGEVEITLDIPIEGKPMHKLTSIKSSGITFDSKTGKAVTDRAATFEFENGDGKSTGASYDPTTHELHLLNNPEMNMRGQGPHSKPMKVQAAEITYQELGSVVFLNTWSRMVRAETTIDAGPSVVHLKDNQVDSIDSQQAHGVDKYPKRELHYSADTLHVTYTDGEISRISGNGNARMLEESEGAVTNTSSKTADLDFAPRDNETVLQHVTASGAAIAESKPAPDAAGHRAESRILKSETIEVAMQADGKDITQIKTHAPSTLEFLPNAPDQHHRILNGDEMLIGYAPKNVIKDFQTAHSTTVTFPPANSKAKNPAPSKTASAQLTATFDSRGQLATMKQWDHFTYEEGERRAKSSAATLDQQANTMDLETGARIWDNSGSTDADKIHLIQKTGDYVADGNVVTSRLPDQDPKKKAGEMLDGDEPIQGTAPHMTSANHNKLVRYDGGAVLWQGSDRISAQQIEIDRDKHLLTAHGKVMTQFLDQQKKNDDKSDGDQGAGAKTAAAESVKVIKVSAKPAKPDAPPPAPTTPLYTVVTADQMIYTDTDRLAHYTGDVVLNRPGLNVKSADLRAFLNPRDTQEDSRLNHALGDGKVEIVESRPDRQRIGKGETGEYITKEDKVILRGNLADLYDSLKNDESHGTELTYFTSDDRLLITGIPKKPVESKIHRKPRLNANSGNR